MLDIWQILVHRLEGLFNFSPMIFISTNEVLFFCRLSISEDPLSLVSIFEQHHPHGLLMWIQCCPYQKTIFLACYKCAGPSPIENVSKGGKSAIKEPVPIADASMQWFFDKVSIFFYFCVAW
jgi:hypothetical protein